MEAVRKMKSKQIFTLCLLSFMMSVCAGCASINSSPIHDVRILSTPENARYAITNEQGEVLAQGTTPDSVKLRSAENGFKAARYYIRYEIDGHHPQTESLNSHFSSWYFVNLLFSVPGLVGLLVVDPFTGALYDMPAQSSVVLQPLPGNS